MKYSVRCGREVFQVEITGRSPFYELKIGERCFRVDAASLGDDSLLTMLLDGASLLAHTRLADARRGLYEISIAGKHARLAVLDELASAAQRLSETRTQDRFVLAAPMPGLVVAVRVQPGDSVQVGTPLVVIEAMKMQNELASEVAGIVREVRAVVDQAVESGYELVVIEAG